MPFVYIHLAAFGFWIVANLGWVPGVPRWDESFVVLAMIASVEAIFLSTFVLISQNRMQAAADKRADLDLQISLLAEHEVTKLAALVSEIAKRLGVETEVDDELREIKRDVAPEAVLDAIDAAKPDPGARLQAFGVSCKTREIRVFGRPREDFPLRLRQFLSFVQSCGRGAQFSSLKSP